jgi:sigma-E factor negative regulatory protein RseA
MDGETLDSELLNELSHSPEMQKPGRVTISSVTLRGDTARFSISISQPALWPRLRMSLFIRPPLIPEAQPAPHQWQKMPFWQKCVRGPVN